MVDLDLSYVRAQFPALASGYVYLDNAGGAQVLANVAARISDYLLTSNVQLGASYEVSELAGARVSEATTAMAEFVHAGSSHDVVMGASSTLLFRILARGLVEHWGPGDEVIVTYADHEANICPWVELERQGIKIRRWQIHPETLRLELSDLEPLLNERTRLLAVAHVSNVLGTLHPIKEIVARASAAGVKTCIDGVAFAPHRAIDLQKLNPDFYVFSFYKVYGPHYAMLCGRKELLEELNGFNHHFIQTVPYKFQPGNVNFELAYGMGAVPGYFLDLARHHDLEGTTANESFAAVFDLISQHEQSLAERLLGFLASKKSVRIIGETSADRRLRVPTISFVSSALSSDKIPLITEPRRIGIRYGDFYAKDLVRSLGLEGHSGVVRVSMVHYNTLEEVDRLIHVLNPILD